MRLLFLGSGAFGLPTLQALSERHEILGVVSQPDRRAGRGGELTPTPISAWAEGNLPGVTLYKPDKVNAGDTVEALRALNADAWVVIAFGQKLSKGLLADVFAINLHASLLPRWRGAAPINAAILGGDTQTGNSVITLADRMDAGLILGQSTRAIDPMQTAGELHDLLAQDGPPLVEDVLARFSKAALTPMTQDETKVTIAPKLSKADGVVDFARSAEEVRRRVHGLTPWPGVSIGFRGQQLKLLRVDTESAAAAGEPGTLIDAERGVIACGDRSSLRLIEVQAAGKRPMPWADFARGARVMPGELLVGGQPGSVGGTGGTGGAGESSTPRGG